MFVQETKQIRLIIDGLSFVFRYAQLASVWNYIQLSKKLSISGSHPKADLSNSQLPSPKSGSSITNVCLSSEIHNPVLGNSLGREIRHLAAKTPESAGNDCGNWSPFQCIIRKSSRVPLFTANSTKVYSALKILLRDRQECDLIEYFVG